MQINGKEYKFKNISLGEVRKLRREIDSSVQLNKDLTTMTDEEFQLAQTEWKGFCERMFESPDEDLSLEKINKNEVWLIPARFFSLMPEDLSALKG